MLKSYKLLFFLGVLILLSSCRSTGDLMYFKGLDEDEQIQGIPSKVPTYRIKPLDNLYVNIKTIEPEINQMFNPTTGTNGMASGTNQMYGDPVSQAINGYQVDTIGHIHLPILGEVKVSGLTIDEATKSIQELGNIYLKAPTVKVRLLSFRVNITGEVNDPGLYYSYDGRMTILDALSMAKGITDEARTKDIIVLRQEGENTITYSLDLSQKDLFESEAYFLFPNDVVYVRPGINKRISLNLTNFSLLLTTLTTFFGASLLNNNP